MEYEGGHIWAWMIWSNTLFLLIPALIYAAKLEIEDLRNASAKKGRDTREEISEHRPAA